MLVLAVISFGSSLPESGVIEAAINYLRDVLHFSDIDNCWIFVTVGIVSIIVQVNYINTNLLISIYK